MNFIVLYVINIFAIFLGIQDVDLTFVCSGDLLTFQNEAHLVVTYSKGQDHTHRIDHTLFLPLGLFCTPTQPQDGQHKVQNYMPIIIIINNNVDRLLWTPPTIASQCRSSILPQGLRG